MQLTIFTVDKFHLPLNLVLALSGEVGELVEIFQWKSDAVSMNGCECIFKQADITHAGEEIADVCIYATRLCDVCKINIPKCIHAILLNETIGNQDANSHCDKWSDLSFEEVQKLIGSSTNPSIQFTSPRTLLLHMITKMGVISNILSSKPDLNNVNNETNAPFFAHWDITTEYNPFVESLAYIFIYLSILCDYFHVSISNVLNDKVIKNAKKYPVHLSKGSAAKYTEYVEQIALETQLNNNAV